jgi:hypothetical protein
MPAAALREASGDDIGTGGQDEPDRDRTSKGYGMSAVEQHRSCDRQWYGKLGDANRGQTRALERCCPAVSRPCGGYGRTERCCPERTDGRGSEPLEQVSVANRQRETDGGDRLGGRAEVTPDERPGSGQDQRGCADQNRGTAKRTDQGPPGDREDRDGDDDQRGAGPEQQAGSGAC